MYIQLNPLGIAIVSSEEVLSTNDIHVRFSSLHQIVRETDNNIGEVYESQLRKGYKYIQFVLLIYEANIK